jgi:hypothetical protein
MKVPVLLFCAALAAHSVRAELLSDADRETLLENLDKLKESAESTMDARFRLAIGAFRNAIASDEAAMELYLKCLEKVNFADQQKTAGDFREWKRKEDAELSDPALRLALRHQLRWLVLTLQAASENADRSKLADDAQSIVDAIFSDPGKLRGQEKTLAQPVTSSVFARAYDINSVKLEKWPLSPVQLEQVYEDILLPPHRAPGRTNELRAVWIKRIQQEGAKIEHMAAEKERNGNGRGDREEKRIGMASAMRPPEYDKFLEDTVPKLQWEMETDLFRSGDQSGAAVRMLAHLEKYISHPSARQWGEQLRALLKSPAAPATAAAPPAPEEPAP